MAFLAPTASSPTCPYNWRHDQLLPGKPPMASHDVVGHKCMGVGLVLVGAVLQYPKKELLRGLWVRL